MTLQEQIDFCKKKVAAGGSEFRMYRAIMDTLLIADKYDLIPEEISGEDYQQFVGIYFEFRRSRGSEPRMNPASGKALKEIIRYLMKIEKVRRESQAALKAWKYILEKWNYLSDYIKSQVALTQINKNIEEIIEQLTYASKKARNQHSANEREQLKNAIKERK